MVAENIPQFIPAPVDLRAKAPITANGVNAEMLAKAEKIIVEMQSEYLVWVEEDLIRLRAMSREVDQTSTPEALSEVFHRVFELAHDMKGQGGSFGYPLVTEVANRLCRFLEQVYAAPKIGHSAVVKVCIDSLHVIISKRMEGDGGAEGARLVAGLDAAIARTRARDSDAQGGDATGEGAEPLATNL